MDILKKTFLTLLARYTDSIDRAEEFGAEVALNYSSEERYYHTQQHLLNLLLELSPVKSEIENWDSVLFTLYYHDIIYDPQRADNEDKSAELAKERMKQLSVSEETIQSSVEQILATRSHIKSLSKDTNYFTDADLSVLGQRWEVYTVYYKSIRKEYSIYSDLVYYTGRKKVLNHFLEMDRIYKTAYFYNKFERQAKDNLRRELKLYK